MGWHDDSLTQLLQLPLHLPLPLYLFRQLIAHQWAPLINAGPRPSQGGTAACDSGEQFIIVAYLLRRFRVLRFTGAY